MGPNERHDFHYTTPAMAWDEALPLGNGLLGALVWGDGCPLRISLDRTDLWDLRPVPEFERPEYSYDEMKRWHRAGRHEDLKRLYEAPGKAGPTKVPAGRLEFQLAATPCFESMSLNLRTGIADISCGPRGRAQIFVHAQQRVGIARFVGCRELGPQLAVPPFGSAAPNEELEAQSLKRLGYPAPKISSGEGWRAFTQKGWEDFEFSVLAAWRRVGEAWLAIWAISPSLEKPGTLAAAREQVEQAYRSGYGALLESHQRWWADYWEKSALELPNALLEAQWYREQYKFGAAARCDTPAIALQGPWTADNGKLPPWKGDYHHDLNTQLTYWPCYSGNHLDEGLGFLNWIWGTLPGCREWTQKFFKAPGLNIPMQADIKNRIIGGWRQYAHSSTTAAWLAQHFYLHWQFSRDSEFLRERAYPFIREAALFLEAMTAERDSAGRRKLPLSASPEIEDNQPQAWFDTLTNYDLALIRWAFGAAAELAEIVGQAGEARHWRGVLAEMPEFSLGEDGRLLIAKDYPLAYSHRHFSHLLAIHPLGLIDVSQGKDAARIVHASLAELERRGTRYWCGYSFAWLACLAARAMDGKAAERALEIFSSAFVLRNSFHCNGDRSGKGYSELTYRPFTLEGNFAAAAALQEMLLQSHAGAIAVFPAIPSGWKDAAFKTLRAQGGFLVSAIRKGGRTERVEIVSECGGPCRVLSPFTGREESHQTTRGQHIVLEGK